MSHLEISRCKTQLITEKAFLLYANTLAETLAEMQEILYLQDLARSPQKSFDTSIHHFNMQCF